MSSFRISLVVGTRPNLMKDAALIEEANCRARVRMALIHTGQHSTPDMSQKLLDQLGLPKPILNLGVFGGTPESQTAEMVHRLASAFFENRPDLVMVVGDVTSTVAGALVASNMGIRLAHVEAGLRSFDRTMPEEVNRVATDGLSDFLFVTEPSGVSNLRAEGMPEHRIFLVGNVMIDTLLRFRAKAAESDVLERLQVRPMQYALVTLHRPSNVDDPNRLDALLDMLLTLASELPIVFPVHPRTQLRLNGNLRRARNLILTGPMGYLDFLCVMAQARIVLTDSGGIQEETTILNVPCLTLRENTERPITIRQGTNQLVGVEPTAILRVARQVLASPTRCSGAPDLWDGKASRRIFDVLEGALDN